jgi:transcriptional regulator with XRE-family HTH domain
MSINERILNILKTNKNLKQKDLANSINVPASTVNNWLKLGRAIPAEYIIPISEYLEIDIYFLLTGTDSGVIHAGLTENDKELLELFHQLPERKQLKLIGYVERMTEELDERQTVTTKEPVLQKTGTGK